MICKNPRFGNTIPRIQQLILEGKNRNSSTLRRSRILGPFFEPYLPLGDLLIKFIHSQPPKKRSYKRSLNINRAIAETTYNIGSRLHQT